MAAIFSALICGLVFGFGLLISGMTDPNKIFGFLDIFGRWDPSLAIVMAVALLFAAPGLLLARRMGRPVVGDQMRWPSKKDIDAPLIAGAAIFGAGWGLSGLCPGPAIENLAVALAQGVRVRRGHGNRNDRVRSLEPGRDFLAAAPAGAGRLVRLRDFPAARPDISATSHRAGRRTGR